MGPKIDIHFWNPEKDEFTSAYNVSRPEYPPELYERKNYSRDVFDRMDRESHYSKQKWYQELSRQLNMNLKEFVLEYCNNLEKITGDLPDIMGFDKNGEETLWAEVKYEGFGTEAREVILKQFELSKERGIPFSFVIPKRPLYSREITDNWINKNLPSEMKVYKFDMDVQIVLPKRSQIKFVEVLRR
ncbi:MAG: hypothetical protein J7L26_07645 [Candidatus Aminicenantes bacterium]|nr:hypothetical protein [Candidatus Aminicenantes bacterium]